MGPSFSASFTFDHSIFVGAILVPFVCLGVGTIAVGLVTRALGSTRPAGTSRVARRALAEIRRQLVQWQVAPTPDDTLVCTVMAVQGRLQGATLIGSGIGLLLALASTIAVSLAATGSILATSALSFQVLLGAIVGGFLIGAAVGYWLGMQPFRRARSVTYADLRPRRLSDYRLGILRWLSIAVIVNDAALTANLASQVGPSLRLELSDGFILILPAFPALVMLPVAMLVIWLSGEWLMRQAVELPRLLVTSDPAVSQRTDEMIRAQVIGALQSATFVALGYLSSAQCALLTFQIARPHPVLSPLDLVLVVLAVLLTAAVLLPGFLLPATRGRLGGAVTGWPWRAKAAA